MDDTHQLVAVCGSLFFGSLEMECLNVFQADVFLPTVNFTIRIRWSKCGMGQNTVHFMGSFTISTGWTDDLIHQPLLKALEIIQTKPHIKPRCLTSHFYITFFFCWPRIRCPFLADFCFFSNIPKKRRFSFSSEKINPSPDDGSRVACSCPEQTDVPNPEPFSGEPRQRKSFFKHYGRKVGGLLRWWEPRGF